MHRILYLGLDPKRYSVKKKEILTHFPLIETRCLPIDKLMCDTIQKYLSEVDIQVFTSRQAVVYWSDWIEKKFSTYSIKNTLALCVGEATKKAAKEQGYCNIKIATYPTQEGIVDWLKKHHTFFSCLIWPRSCLARQTLATFLQTIPLKSCIVDMYTTIPKKLIPIPIDGYDRIVFTSPSVVQAFIQLYGILPPIERIETIGPITQKVVQEAFQNQTKEI